MVGTPSPIVELYWFFIQGLRQSYIKKKRDECVFLLISAQYAYSIVWSVNAEKSEGKEMLRCAAFCEKLYLK